MTGEHGAAAGHLPSLDAIPPTDDVILVNGPDRWSFARLAQAVERLAAGLVASGIGRGDRVALHLRNGPEIAVACLACFRIGAIAAPLNVRLKQAELDDVLRRLRPAVYIGQQELYRHVVAVDRSILPLHARFLADAAGDATARPWTVLHAAPEAGGLPHAAAPDAPILLLMTSGTTGYPKFVAHSLRTLTEIADRTVHLGLRAGQVHAFFLPMAHMSGLAVFLAGIRLGGRLVLCDAGDPDSILDQVERHRCDCMAALPATMALLMQSQRRQPRDVSSLRVCLTAGDACPPGQQEAFQALFGLPLLSFWASTEAVGSLAPGLRPGAVSRVVPGAEIRIVDDHGNDVPPGMQGEMLLRGPNVMLGYWQRPGVVSGLENGWYRSGDQMRLDAGGNAWFVARLKELIVRGGSNIAPAEVERAILAHPGATDAGVVGVPDPVLGQRVVAFVQLAEAGDDVLPDIRRSLSAQLADYKLPDRLFRIDSIPRTPIGKVDRQRLLALAADWL